MSAERAENMHEELRTKDGEPDKRHGDPEKGGLSSGQKAAITRAAKAEQAGEKGNELHFLKDNPEKQEAAEEYKKEKGFA
jgi:hypothetical protein